MIDAAAAAAPSTVRIAIVVAADVAVRRPDVARVDRRFDTGAGVEVGVGVGVGVAVTVEAAGRGSVAVGDVEVEVSIMRAMVRGAAHGALASARVAGRSRRERV
jgi:hypothetical protein